MDPTSPISRPLTPSARTLPRKASAKNLDSAPPPQGARPKAHSRSERPKTLHASPPSKNTTNSSGRGLTVRIQDGMALPQSIQSAPVKMIRPLPNVPVPPLPTASSVIFPTPSISLAASSRSAGVSDQLTPRRALRPLPCPPHSSNLSPVTTPPRQMNPTPSPPTERARAPVAKPLPVPVLKVEPLRVSRHTPSQSLPCNGSPLLGSLDTPIRSPRSRTPRPPSLPPLPEKVPRIAIANLHAHSRDSSRDELLLDVEPIKASALFPQAPIRKRIILSRYELLDDSDQASEEEDDLFADVESYKREDGDEGTDYSWILSNRILCRQLSPEVEDTRKWVREKKGRRITEQDYDNILHALRSL